MVHPQDFLLTAFLRGLESTPLSRVGALGRRVVPAVREVGKLVRTPVVAPVPAAPPLLPTPRVFSLSCHRKRLFLFGWLFLKVAPDAARNHGVRRTLRALPPEGGPICRCTRPHSGAETKCNEDFSKHLI